jgi:hypothetical protein
VDPRERQYAVLGSTVLYTAKHARCRVQAASRPDLSDLLSSTKTHDGVKVPSDGCNMRQQHHLAPGNGKSELLHWIFVPDNACKAIRALQEVNVSVGATPASPGAHIRRETRAEGVESTVILEHV